MRIAAALALAGLALILAPGRGAARIHGQMYCWALDSELPVVCDGEEAEEEEVSAFRDQVSGSRQTGHRPDP